MHKNKKEKESAVEKATKALKETIQGLKSQLTSARAQVARMSTKNAKAEADAIRSQGRAADAEAQLENTAKKLKAAVAVNKDLAADLRAAEDEAVRLADELAELQQHDAEDAAEAACEAYDEAIGVDKKTRDYPPEMREKVIKMLALRIPPSAVGPLLEMMGYAQPSLTWIYNMRRELRIVVLLLAAAAAADPSVSSRDHIPFVLMLSHLATIAAGHVGASRHRCDDLRGRLRACGLLPSHQGRGRRDL
jgi:hypothetical protein